MKTTLIRLVAAFAIIHAAAAGELFRQDLGIPASPFAGLGSVSKPAASPGVKTTSNGTPRAVKSNRSDQRVTSR